MPLKNLFLIIFITILLSSVLYVNLDSLTSIFQKITGYTSIVIYGTVVAPQSSTPTQQENGSTTLTATVTQPQESPAQISTPEATVSSADSRKTEKYINQTVLSQVINQTEILKVRLDKLRSSSIELLNYYSSINDTQNTEKWISVVTLFNQALDDLEDIQKYAESVEDSATKENVDTIKSMINDVLKTLDKIVRLVRNN